MDISKLIHPAPDSKRSGQENPRCLNPVHDAHGTKARKSFRQRHTCAQCCLERVATLVHTGVEHYVVVKIITKEFRSYWCPFCLMEADLVRVSKGNLHTHCQRHAAFLAQKRCPNHNKRWTDCNLCEDPRAGSSFCPCGVKLGGVGKKGCMCKRSKTVLD
uniref:Uncharacterized protein n=1 Tax=Cryptomonas curvata TaxID=233186 RepID=A0A7S0QMN9_9CRYP|mmetsp:Transcript_36911/g.77088  ORF Transcript_36911/g.77088 Transcript_36911/m.77088 type:complete len:160 (+) Transcript_36911:74-553(+)